MSSEETPRPNARPRGSVLIVGGGIAGIQAALDLANADFRVHLVEKNAGIGGVMPQLDKTFPTNDCSMCIVSPKLVECGRHPNIVLHTLTEVLAVDGEAGDFRVRLHQSPRYVDMDKCTACGVCAEKCPKKVPDDFNAGLSNRKAAYIHYGQTVPLKYAIDARHCIYLTKGKCRACEKFCPPGAINFADQPKEFTLEVGAVIMAPGFKAFDPSVFENYGYGVIKDVVTSLEYERLSSASGPCMGHIQRPSDKAEPKSVAWIQCVGSRALNKCDNPYCSSVCCMYAVKQAVMVREHASGPVETNIFFMDMRTFGKGFEACLNSAGEKGVRFVRARPHTLMPGPDGKGVIMRYADGRGRETYETFDLVILSVGLTAPRGARELAQRAGIRFDEWGFAACAEYDPVATSRPGVYACGAFAQPKDIPQSVVEAGAAACSAAALLAPARGSEVERHQTPPQMDVAGDPPRVGVFVCSCGVNIAGVVDVAAVTEYAKTLPHVVHAANNLFTCSQDTQDLMAEAIREHRLNRVVVAACTPKTHEPLFQETMVQAGLNKYLFEMANIRNQCSWVHAGDHAAATRKSMDMVRMAVAGCVPFKPLAEPKVSIKPAALVVGGGLAGLTAAREFAAQGFPVHLVERGPELGGHATKLRQAAGHEVEPYISALVSELERSPLVSIHRGTTVKSVEGFVGNFMTELASPSGREMVAHGAAVLAVGAAEFKPREYSYGKHKAVMTHLEIDAALNAGDIDPADLNCVVFIQCVGSREPERPYCSKVCCTHTARAALEIKRANPECMVIVLYRDMRTYGVRELVYQQAREAGVIYARYDVNAKPVVTPDGSGVKVRFTDHILEMDVEVRADLLGLASAMVPSGYSHLAECFKIPLDADGWFAEAHQKLRPVDFAVDGVFMAGLCHYPKPMEEAVAQAKAAVARACAVLSRSELTMPGTVAFIDKAACVGCGVCWQVCPYKAIGPDEKGLAQVNEILCKGCGLCAASCRSGAPNLRGFTTESVLARISACLDEEAEYAPDVEGAAKEDAHV